MSARFPIQKGDALTAWAVGALRARPFPGEARAMEDRVDYRFVNGWVDVGDLPCREDTWAEIRSRSAPERPRIEVDELRLPGFSRRLDFSGFWHLPHRLTRAAEMSLEVPRAGRYDLRLVTCGGVTLWQGSTLVARFEPFTRNDPQVAQVTLDLPAGPSTLTLLAEEMAERDTQFFVELTWLSETCAHCILPGEADPETLQQLMALARDVRPAGVVFGPQDPLRLEFDCPALQPVRIEASFARSDHLRHLGPLWQAETELPAGARQVDLGQMDLPDGYHPLHLTLSVGDSRVTREIRVARLSQPQPETLPAGIAARKALALAGAAEAGGQRIAAVLARLGLGRGWSFQDAGILNDTLAGITARRDCSDFTLVPLLWLMQRYGDCLPAERHTAARMAILGYRYWMTEPGNDAMWFWSENHVLCFHVSQYLAGRLYPEDVFSNSGRTGAQHEDEATRRLHRWFDAVERDGLAEWNSAAYYPIDFIGLLALAELAKGDIRSRATALLDQLFSMIALHCCGGVPAGSMGRAYDKELRAGPLTELAPFAAVGFGLGWLGGGGQALPMFCLSGYEPPAKLSQLATPKAPIAAHYTQGHGQQGRLALYKTPALQLSAAIDAAPGARGHQQHLVDVHSAANPFARVWINHPGADDPWSEARPSYWAGNGRMPRVGMTGDTALMLFETGDGLPFTHAYAPASQFDEIRHTGDQLLLRSGAGAVVLKASAAIRPVTDGPGAGIEWRCEGGATGWMLQIRDLPPGGLAALEAEITATRLTLTPALELSQPDRPSLRLDADKGLFRDGSPLPFPTQSTHPQITFHTTG